MIPLLLVSAERPATPVTLSETFATVPEVCAALARATGQPFDAAPALRDRKILVLCRDRSAAEVMRGMESALGLRFSPTKRGWALVPDPEVDREEAAQERLEVRLSQAQARRKLEAMMAFADRPLAERREEYQKFERTPGPREEPELSAWREKYRMYNSLFMNEGTEAWSLGWTLRRAPRGTIERILSGEPFHASNSGLAGTAELPPLGSIPPGRNIKEDKKRLISVAYDPETRSLRWPTASVDDPGSYSKTHMESPFDPNAEAEFAADPLTKRWREWAKVPDALAATPLKGEIPPMEPESPNATVSMAAHLVWLHRRTGLPVIAEPTRRADSFARPFAGKTLGEWLAKSAESRYGTVTGWVWRFRGEDGWFLARPARARQLRRGEIPERLIRPYAGKRELTLDEAATFANGLTETQVALFKTSPWSLPFSAMLLGELRPLRLYAALGPGTRRAALGAGAPLASAGPLAIERARDLLRRTMIEGFPSPELMPALIAGEYPPDLSVFLRTTTTRTQSSEALPDYEKSNGRHDVQYGPMETFQLRLGRTPESRLVYHFPLRKVEEK